MQKVSIIFKEKPEKWGLRGDPYFWEYLEDIFNNYELSFEYEKLEKIIKDEHFKLTGVELTKDSIAKCEQFEHGGMSSGGLSGEFWITVALPTLKERLEKEQETKNFNNTVNGRVFENVIGDKSIKEHYGDLAISILSNKKQLDLKKDLKHLVIEFAYLFKANENDYPTLFKVIVPSGLFKPQRIYYFGSQDGKLLLLDSKFKEELFREIQRQMFTIHKVDVSTIDWNKYKMELY